jgi:hypothetical protein
LVYSNGVVVRQMTQFAFSAFNSKVIETTFHTRKETEWSKLTGKVSESAAGTLPTLSAVTVADQHKTEAVEYFLKRGSGAAQLKQLLKSDKFPQ